MSKLFEILIAHRRIAKSLTERDDFYPLLAQTINYSLPSADVYLFGSAFAGTARPDSDIDILIASPELPNIQQRSLVVAGVRERFPHVNIELHFAGPDELAWYRQFIKNQWRKL